MYLYLKNNRVILKYDIVFVNRHFDKDEFGNILEAITDDVVFKFSMPTEYLKFSNKPDLVEKHKDKKRITWAYCISLDQKADISDKMLSLNMGVNKIFVNMLEPIGFTFNINRVVKMQNEITNRFLKFYGDKKSKKEKGRVI